MGLVIPNIGLASLNDPATSALRAVISKMDSVVLDVDSKMNPIMGGPGMYAIAYGSADRKPKVSLKGPEVPLGAFATLTGGNSVVASSGSPVTIPMLEEYTVGSGGTVTLNNAISASNTTVSVTYALGQKVLTPVTQATTTLTTALVSGTAYTTLSVNALNAAVASGDSITIGTGGTTQTVTASAAAAKGATSITVNSFNANSDYAIGASVVDSTQPSAGSFLTPAPSATTLTFNSSDAGKAVFINYNMDSTTGGQVNVTASSIPNPQKFIAQAKVLDSEDPNGLLVPVTFVVPKCLFIGNWQVSQERQKASTTSIDLDIMDPGGNQPAIIIYTAAKFAG